MASKLPRPMTARARHLIIGGAAIAALAGAAAAVVFWLLGG